MVLVPVNQSIGEGVNGWIGFLRTIYRFTDTPPCCLMIIDEKGTPNSRDAF
jgi:hypothetical protein